MILSCLALYAALAVVSVVESEDPLKSEYEAYKKTFGKQYSAEENERRFKIYIENKKFIEEHNRKHENGEVSYVAGINQFSDMTHEEWVAQTSCLKRGDEKYDGPYFEIPEELKNKADPEAMDWREKGCVTPVKDQNPCGSCYAFGSTGALECLHYQKTGKLVSLSEQNIVDCSEKDSGCKGGNIFTSFDYVIENKGIDTEESYPYIAKESGSCKFKKDTIGATLTKYERTVPKDEIALKKIVAGIGTVAVGVNAKTDAFHHYKKGILNVTVCPGEIGDLTHAMLIVGYGAENGQKYWIVKNSWGDKWGENGYVRMPRERNNLCGIATEAFIPTAE